MTIIYANWGDDDTKTLPLMWKGIIPQPKVIELTFESSDWEDEVDNAIANEDDTLILCGHGTTNGLLFPCYDFGIYAVHENNVHLIHAKNVICYFCHASTFCMNNNVKGFSTSMFVTNINEAKTYNIKGLTQEDINLNTNEFIIEVNHLLIDKAPLNQWVMMLGAKMDIESELDKFNRQGLCYFE